jgi:RNase P subunit RPR2
MTERHVNSPSSFQIHSRCRKHLVFVDTHGVADVVGDVERMAATGYPIEWNRIGKDGGETVDQRIDHLISAKRSWPDVRDTRDLRAYLENQPMGTHLYIAAAWESVRRLTRIADEVGYAKEDIQIRGYGPKYQRVFCIACYTINPIGDASTVRCRNCGKLLSVTDHYSRRLDAVMGWLVLDTTKK